MNAPSSDELMDLGLCELAEKFGVDTETAWRWKLERRSANQNRGRKAMEVPPASELEGTLVELGKRFGVHGTTVMLWKRQRGVSPGKRGSRPGSKKVNKKHVSRWSLISSEEWISSTNASIGDRMGVTRQMAHAMRQRYAPESAAIRRANR